METHGAFLRTPRNTPLLRRFRPITVGMPMRHALQLPPASFKISLLLQDWLRKSDHLIWKLERESLYQSADRRQEMKHTVNMVSFLGKIENINHGGCGFAALLIARAVKLDGLTPVIYCDKDVIRQLRKGDIERCCFDHFVVKIRETKSLLEAGSCEAHPSYANYAVPEKVLRQLLRKRSLWNRAFDRTSLKLVRHVLLPN